MKKISFILTTVASALLLTFTACKKDKPANSTDTNALTAGRAFISFNSSPDFAGSSTFYSKNDASSRAIITAAGSGCTITLTTGAPANGSKVAGLYFTVFNATSTSGGNLTGSFDGNSTVVDASIGVYKDLDIFYGEESGTVTITKLTATEVEGTFSCIVNPSSTTGGSNLSLTSGAFAGKF